MFHPVQHFSWCTLHISSWWQCTALTYFFPNLEPVCRSMSSSNCCFLTCIQISGGRSGHLVSPSLEEFSSVCCDPHNQRLQCSQWRRSRWVSGMKLIIPGDICKIMVIISSAPQPLCSLKEPGIQTPTRWLFWDINKPSPQSASFSK